ncbi:MAG: N-acetylmuramoyl-L-alanine amidase [Lachnospiraceae bacterium]|nr:N-acetylmuramoyl-L-alanine amidase [Lachnospiraceae bacterium]
MPKTIIIDPGHGGFDPGAVYGDRREKDDNLRLALAVGQELENAGYNIVYTRTDDRYDSPYDKAQIANNAGGDLFLSFHRNFAERPDLYHGVQALVYDKNPLALRVAKDVNEELEKIGFDNLGIESRKELVVLRRTNMPAVLLEVGFINSSVDNQIFDDKFSAMTNAIATGVEQAFPLNDSASVQPSTETQAANQEPPMMPPPEPMPNRMMQENMMPNNTMTDRNARQDMTRQPMNNNDRMMNDMRLSLNGIQCELVPNRPVRPEPRMWYYVQVGLFRYPENAVYLMEQLKQQGYSSIWRRVGGLIAIWVGPMETLDEAVAMQQKLQADGYDTLIVTGDYISRS